MHGMAGSKYWLPYLQCCACSICHTLNCFLVTYFLRLYELETGQWGSTRIWAKRKVDTFLTPFWSLGVHKKFVTSPCPEEPVLFDAVTPYIVC